MYKKDCPYCSKAIEYKKYQQYAAHISNCSQNPVRDFKNRNIKKSLAKLYGGEYCNFKVRCFKCSNEFEVSERSEKFPTKEKYFCSNLCAKSRILSEEVKEKIRDSLLNTLSKNTKKEKKVKASLKKDRKRLIKRPKKLYKDKLTRKKCIKCLQIFEGTRGKKTCSPECKKISQQIGGSKGGKKSSTIQTKRSKNEIYFSELCQEYFGKDQIITNEPIFNGWDADVIIPSLKIAILWNGVWHYKKITKAHSVKQVQNRDKIKIKEIEQFGYTSYIIKDPGKYSKKFVKLQFDIFINNMQRGLVPQSVS